jgi:extracellular elastinolytic metalloproteinase
MKVPVFRPRVVVPAVLTVLALLVVPEIGTAAPPSEKVARDKKAFFDVRQTPRSLNELRSRAGKLRSHPPAAAASLKRSLGVEGVLSLDPLTSTVRMVGRTDGFLTRPSRAPAASIALGYATRNAAALGLTRQVISSLRLARDYVSIGGTHHLFFVQSVGRVPVFGNGLKANVAKNGRLINLQGSPLGGLRTVSPTARIRPGAAIAAAKRDVGLVTIPLRGESAKYVYFRTVRGTRLAYQTIVGSGSAQYLSVVDARNAAVLYRNSLVDYASA